MKGITVSIIVPAHRDGELLRQCISRLGAQRFPKNQIEILLIDNTGGRSSIHRASGGLVRVVSEPVPGSYAARNAGVKNARGAIIGFTDSDCLPELTWVHEAVTLLQAKPEISRLGGRVKVEGSNSRGFRPAEIYECLFAFPQDFYIQREKAAATANMFARREVFDDVGYFREDMFSGSDLEWGARASAMGYRIEYAPTVVVRHPARTQMTEVLAKAQRVGGGQYYRSQRPFIDAHLSMIKAFVPPYAMFIRAWQQDAPLARKITGMAIHYLLKFVKAGARLGVAYGFQASRY